MLKEYFFLEASFYFSKKWFYLLLIFFAGMGYFISLSANLSFPGMYLNSPYSLTYLTGLLSLINIFTVTIFSAQVLLREKDTGFDAILYATPMRKTFFLLSRMALIVFITTLTYLLFHLGLIAGHLTRGHDTERFMEFHFINYLYPFLVLVMPNIFFCTAIVCLAGWASKSKMLLYLSGLFIYILYIVVSLFSNSPMFANASPVPAETMSLMAKLDPFGLSAFFEQCKPWNAQQRNTQLVQLQGNFLKNRIGVLLFSIALAFIALRIFHFTPGTEQKVKKRLVEKTAPAKTIVYKPVPVTTSSPGFSLRGFWSFVSLDIRSMTKSIPFAVILVLWAFFNGMETYSDIDAGMRMPQRYATTGLMIRNIIGDFPFFILSVLLFYGVEMLWRSRNVKMDALENSTPVSPTVMLVAKWMSLSIISFLLIAFSILMGVFLQFVFEYVHVEWWLYASLFYVLGVPATLCAGIIIGIQAIVKKKYPGIVLAAVFLLVTNSFVGGMFGIEHPLFRFARSTAAFTGDMNGFGSYLNAFNVKMLYWSAFTILTTTVAGLVCGSFKRVAFFNQLKQLKPLNYIVLILCLVTMLGSGVIISNNTNIVSSATRANWQQEYEQQYREFQNMPQPTIVSVKTTIDLYPDKNSYAISGEYVLVNKQAATLKSLLLYCQPSVTLRSVWIQDASETKSDTSFGHYSYEIAKPLAPGDSITMKFEIAYSWSPYNDHDPMNVIEDNASFMRISRYYPVLGYQPGNEIGDEAERKRRNLPTATPLKKIASKDGAAYDYGFINFDAIISTDENQTAIGTGELVNTWKKHARNYFHYASTAPIPFRFAVSSADYSIKKSWQDDIAIEVYYDARHCENADQLITETKRALTYCETNFGKYPFKSIRFAEISGFTRGFNATAYPAVIFMNETVTFHADLRKEKTRDVINELVGHELSHQWWGNNQISPDDNREGAALLTETLAMYTELMLYKSKHGKEAMKSAVAMYRSLYENGKLTSKDGPLYKVSPGNANLSYNRGLLAMYELHELIGEQKINLALKNLLTYYSYPHQPPTSLDLIREFLKVTDPEKHYKIKKMFI